MKRLTRAVLDAYLAGHHGVISRRTALGLGLRRNQVEWCLSSGAWRTVYRGVYMVANQEVGPEARLVAACLAAGSSAVASHRSAAWLWGLMSEPPDRPTVTVAIPAKVRVSGIDVYRRGDLDAGRVIFRRGVSVTDPLRTLADLGEVVDERDLDDAIDRALAGRLLTVDGLEAEATRIGRQGRRGVMQLRFALQRRGLVQGPTASVLESRLLRLLKRWGVTPLAVEAVAGDGRYRLDVLLSPGLALEVDGYAFHWSPESKAADSRRRNRLALAGVRVIEADWVTVMRDPEGLRLTVEAALEQHRAAGRAGTGTRAESRSAQTAS